jgi:hypothetical protein
LPELGCNSIVEHQAIFPPSVDRFPSHSSSWRLTFYWHTLTCGATCVFNFLIRTSPWHSIDVDDLRLFRYSLRVRSDKQLVLEQWVLVARESRKSQKVPKAQTHPAAVPRLTEPPRQVTVLILKTTNRHRPKRVLRPERVLRPARVKSRRLPLQHLLHHLCLRQQPPKCLQQSVRHVKLHRKR